MTNVVSFPNKHNEPHKITKDDVTKAWTLHVKSDDDDMISYDGDNARIHHKDGSHTDVVGGNQSILEPDTSDAHMMHKNGSYTDKSGKHHPVSTQKLKFLPKPHSYSMDKTKKTSNIIPFTKNESVEDILNEGYRLEKSNETITDLGDKFYDKMTDQGPQKEYERDYKVIHNKTGKHIATLHTRGNDYFGGSDYSDLTLHHADGRDMKVAGPQHTAKHPDKAINRHFKKPTRKIAEVLKSHGINESIIDERDILTPTIGASKITPGMSKIDKILATHELKATIKKRIKFDSKLYPKWTKPNMKISTQESVITLIEAITNGNTLISNDYIDVIMREKINEKVETKRKEVAKSIGNIGIALKDKNVHVRMAAAKHPNATHEHLKQAITDPHLHVRLAALSNPNLDKPEEDKEKEEANAKTKETIIKHLGKLK